MEERFESVQKRVVRSGIRDAVECALRPLDRIVQSEPKLVLIHTGWIDVIRKLRVAKCPGELEHEC